jgi:ABC-type multidrug transport system fused ATPase/permease subunit
MQTTEENKTKLTRESLGQALRIFKYVAPYKWYLIGGFVLLILGSLIFMLFPWLIGQMVDVASGESSLEFDLRQLGIALFIVLIFQGFFSYLRVILFANASERGIADLRKELYSKIICQPLVFFEKNRIGDIISRLTADVESLYSAFSITLAEFVRQLIILFSGIVFLLITTPRLSGIMLLTVPIIMVGAILFGRYIRKLSKKRQKELADTNIILNETTESINSVKAFTNEFFEITRYNSAIEKMVGIAIRFAKGRAAFSAFIIVVLFGALFFIIWQGSVMVQNGEISTGSLVAFVSYTMIIGGAIAGLGNFYTQLLGAVGATERVREILGNEREVLPWENAHQKEIALKGQISFDNVNFSYPTRLDFQVINDLSFDISPGEKIALVGHSGAGKSTIVQLLLRFYKSYTGEIRVDGKDARSYNISDYRANIGIVPQEVILFGGTIRENIAYGKPGSTEKEIKEAADKANALDFIESFPEGLETIVGERGIKLSGGQRQRIAIARAVLKDPAILLLDEATSSLDAENEKLVQEALDELMKNRTSIIIAHRLATIKSVDRIIVIDKGQILESGSHEELIKSDNGHYKALAELQFQV